MVVDDSLCMRIYSFIDYILINKTILKTNKAENRFYRFLRPPSWVDSNCSYYQRLYTSDVYLAKETLSYDTKVDDLVTLTVIFDLRF